jgi:hypothetical protein
MSPRGAKITTCLDFQLKLSPLACTAQVAWVISPDVCLSLHSTPLGLLEMVSIEQGCDGKALLSLLFWEEVEDDLWDEGWEDGIDTASVSSVKTLNRVSFCSEKCDCPSTSSAVLLTWVNAHFKLEQKLCSTVIMDLPWGGSISPTHPTSNPWDSCLFQDCRCLWGKSTREKNGVIFCRIIPWTSSSEMRFQTR